MDVDEQLVAALMRVAREVAKRVKHWRIRIVRENALDIYTNFFV